MNQVILKAQWAELKGRVREKWGQLTQDDLEQVQGDWEVLSGKLQQRYGRGREQVEKELAEWLDDDPTERLQRVAHG